MTGKMLHVVFRTIRAVGLSPMVKVDGLWVHYGVPDTAVDWDRVIDDAREERIAELLQRAFPPANGECGA